MFGLEGPNKIKQHWTWLVPLALATSLLIVSYFNVLLFHTLAELFAIAVAITLSVVAWHMYPFTKNNYLMFLGCGYFWVAMLDLFHALAYKGIGVFGYESSNPTVELWLMARYFEATILLLSPLFLTALVKRNTLFGVAGVIAFVLGALVFTDSLPVAYIEGQGLTSFKIFSEYTIIALMIAAIVFLWQKRSLVEARIFKLVVTSIGLTICAELFFTFYLTIFDFSNIAGHIFKLFSFWLIFIAVIRTTLESPFLALARDASTYNAIPDATIVVDADGFIRQVNQAAVDLAAQERIAIIGQHCHDLYHPGELDIMSCPICEKIIKFEATRSIEITDPLTQKHFDFALSPIGASQSMKGMVLTIRDISDKKQAEIQLHQSERYNRLLFERSPIGLALCQMDGRLVDVNPAFAKVIGYSIDEVMELSYWQITPKKYATQEQAQLDHLIAYGHYGPYEKEYRHKDGHLIPVRLHGTLFEKDGVSYIWSSVQDTSIEQEAEKELTEFRSALDASEDNIFLVNFETMRFMNFNKSAVSTLGYERDELLMMGPPDIAQEFSKEDMQSIMAPLLSGEQEFIDVTTYHVCKDGRTFPAEIRLSALQLNGRTTIIAMARDISARQLVGEKLGQSAAVVENTAEGIIITDKERFIVSVNPAFSEITGFSEDEAIGQNPRILKSDHQDQEFFTAMWDQINSTGRWQGEILNRKKDGSLFPSWSTISSVKNDAGEITHYVGVFSDISTLKQSQEKLDYLAYHDTLTQLPNRLLLLDRLDHALRVAERNATKIGVLFLDLDRFKNINDSLGHSTGDRLLQRVAQRIQTTIRQEDTVARLGGDEFIVLIEGIHHASDVVVLANKLLSAFNDSFDLGGHTLFISPSIGVSIYPQDGSDCETLIRNADTAMYRAKEVGRNNCHLYSADLTEQAMERLTLESALRNAIENDELELYYQPQFSLANNRAKGAEALIRWNHPELGQVMPDRFIPLAEDSGLIMDIGTWAIKTACRQMKSWQNSGLELDVVAVNVSGLQFQRGDIVETVQSALSDTGLAPECLELEITESIILNRTDQAINTLHQLKELGVMISIDDFGTGYSSLSQLKHLPVDKLKIDQSFVRDIAHDVDDEAITCAVIALAKSLDLKVIAEGVETEDQRNFLVMQGCDEGQGYLYSRAVSAERLEKQLRAGDFMCA